MIEFVCDTCSAIRQDDEPWILGMAAEALGVTASRREVTLFPTWDNTRAVHPLAVHFCSIECKDKYMQRLFGSDAPTGAPQEVLAERPVAVEAVIERVLPAKRRHMTRVKSRGRTQKKSA